jgi:hypothetical protein
MSQGCNVPNVKRRNFLKGLSVGFLPIASVFECVDQALMAAELGRMPFAETATGRDWLARWEKSIISDARNRYCDKEMGEELGWRVSPFLNGFYYGYLATRETKWIELLIDWTDSCIRRGLKEPDGFIGWPKGDGGGHESDEYKADSLLGEAMMLRPVVLMADVIRKNADLKKTYGAKADEYIELAEKIFEKWDSRDCWREAKEGGVWVVPDFGIDLKKGGWSSGYAARKTSGFTNPDNKENHIARWMLAMYDVTKKPIYRDRANDWFRVMAARMKLRETGKYYVWNYWEPAGRWDYKRDGLPKHWVGVHPNGGYYDIDVEAIVCAFEHNIVFTRSQIDKLIATNRDFMWNQKVEGARFQRIDGGETDARWKETPGVLWDALVPYDRTLMKIFIANNRPDSWSGLSSTPWFLALGSRSEGE